MKAFALHDLPFLARGSTGTARDNMEQYTDGEVVNGLSYGLFAWSGVLPYIARTSFIGIYSRDNMESYSDGSSVDALNGGLDWTGAYVARDNYTGVKGIDNMESYSDGASLDGLNGGTGWTGAWIGR